MLVPNIWFTSDQHYGHKNIIRYCHRPFSSVEEMDEKMIDNHNALVGEKDYIYMLGDFSFKGGKDIKSRYFDRLNGKKILIKGNHDGKETLKLPWESVYDVLHLKIKRHPGWHKDPREIFLSHYSHRSWNKSFHGVGHLFGHTHSKLGPYFKSFDVGVDCTNFTPMILEDVFAKFDELEKGFGKAN